MLISEIDWNALAQHAGCCVALCLCAYLLWRSQPRPPDKPDQKQ